MISLFWLCLFFVLFFVFKQTQEPELVGQVIECKSVITENTIVFKNIEYFSENYEKRENIEKFLNSFLSCAFSD